MRRGFHPADHRHYDRYSWSYVDPWDIEETWLRLLQADPCIQGIVGAERIAEVMGVAPSTSYPRRRVLDALGLVHVIPGIRGERHAELHIKDPTPSAWADAYREMGGDLYIVSRSLDTVNEACSMPRSARSGRPGTVWISRDQGHAVLGMKKGGDTPSNHRYRTTGGPVQSFDVVSPPPLDAVVLVKRTPSEPLSTERSEETSKHRLLCQDPPLTVPDLETLWGCSRKTAYRRIEQGDAIKVGRGKYRLPPDVH